VAEADLEQELRALARAIDTGEPPPLLAVAVMDRVAAEPVPVRSASGIVADRAAGWVRGRVRWLVGVLVALLGAGVVVAPVGAEVAEWFGIGGVVVRTGPGSSPAATADPQVPEAPGTLRLEEAAEVVGFTPEVPSELGPPRRLAVIRDGTVVSMSWRDPAAGTLRLDQFELELAPYWWKTAADATPTHVGSHDALWIDQPHELVLLDAAGGESTMPSRLAAQTLVWVVGQRTFRLEGDLGQARAIEIAASVR